MIIDSILGFLGSAAFGGITGLIGTGIHAYTKLKEKRLDMEHEREMRELDLKEMTAASKLRVQETEAKIEGELKITEAKIEGAAFAASHESDRATYSRWAGLGRIMRGLLALVDVIRGLMRPAVTLWGAVTLTWLAAMVTAALGGLPELVKENPAAAWKLLMMVVDAIVFIATTSATWWFGSRRMRQGGKS